MEDVMSRDKIKQIDKLIEIIILMIRGERESKIIYQKNAKKAPTEMSRLLFKQLAEQEEVHEKKLRAALELLECEKKELS
jgi:rubrerythrin